MLTENLIINVTMITFSADEWQISCYILYVLIIYSVKFRIFARLNYHRH